MDFNSSHPMTHFTHEELRHQNDDIRSGSRFNLVNTFTREEIEVEFILDCLFVESQIQRTPDSNSSRRLVNEVCTTQQFTIDRSLRYTAVFKARSLVSMTSFGPS